MTAVVLAGGGPTRWAGIRVDLLVASAIYLPILWLWARNRLSTRGDPALGFGLMPVLLVAGVLFVVVADRDDVLQVLAIAALAALLAASAWFDLRSRRRRIAAGELTATVTRTPLSGWR